MSPRSRTLPDTDLLAATSRAISRIGPLRLTLADVAGEVGLAPATLLQRFGSKRGLLLAFARAAGDDVAPHFITARAVHSSILDALVHALIGMTAAIQTPEELSNHLAFLQMDLTDPQFHQVSLGHAEAVVREIHTLLEDAAHASELQACDLEHLSWSLHITYNGALITWAIYRNGTLADWLRQALEATLEPFRPVR